MSCILRFFSLWRIFFFVGSSELFSLALRYKTLVTPFRELSELGKRSCGDSQFIYWYVSITNNQSILTGFIFPPLRSTFSQTSKRLHIIIMRIRSKHFSSKVAVDRLPSTLEESDTPSVVESDVSSIASSFSLDIPTTITTPKKRKPLQWEFKGLTLWLEFEEFDGDLTKANEFLASKYGTEVIPCVHATAIYGMEHLTVEEAKDRLSRIPNILPGGKWPLMGRPVAIKQDISQEGLPGQVCSVAWAELTLKTSLKHEAAMDALSKLFDVERSDGQLWTPHISLAYDNPEDSVLDLSDIVSFYCHISRLSRFIMRLGLNFPIRNILTYFVPLDQNHNADSIRCTNAIVDEKLSSCQIIVIVVNPGKTRRLVSPRSYQFQQWL